MCYSSITERHRTKLDGREGGREGEGHCLETSGLSKGSSLAEV